MGDEDMGSQDKDSQLKDRQDKKILDAKLRNFYFVSILSLLFAVLGFTYNAWRLEQSEENNNIRSASFQILVELAELEQIIYLAHYDKDLKEGSPRKGWIEVGLINDLSMLVGDSVYTNATELKSSWSARWQLMNDDRVAVDQLVTDIEGNFSISQCTHSFNTTLPLIRSASRGMSPARVVRSIR